MISLSELQEFLVKQETEKTIEEILIYFAQQGKKCNALHIESLRKYDMNIEKNYKSIDQKIVSSYFYEKSRF